MGRATLRKVLALNFSVIAVAPLLLLALLLLVREFAWLDQARDRHRLVAEAVQVQTELFLQAPYGVLRNLAAMLDVASIKAEARVRLLDASAAEAELFESIYRVDGDDRVVEVGLPLTHRGSRANFIGVDLSRLAFIRRARETNRPLWSNAHLSLISGKVSLALAYPLREQLLIGTINIDHLAGFLSRMSIEQNLLPMILDGKGSLIAHPSVELSLQQVNLSSLPPIRGALDGAVTTGEFEFLHQPFVGTAVPMPEMGWVTLAAVPVDEFYADALRSTLAVGFAIALALLLGVWTAMRRARAIAKPLQDFSAQAAAVSHGRALPPTQEYRVQELDELATTLRRMANTVEERELRLQASEQRYRGVVEGTGDLVLLLDEAGRVTFASAATRSILATEPDACVGKGVETWIHYEDRAEMAAILAHWPDPTSDRLTLENRVMPARDAVRHLLWSIAVGRDERGQAIGYTCVGRDISERKKYEQQLTQQKEAIERSAIEEQGLLQLSSLSLEAVSMSLFLRQALDLILDSFFWLPIEKRGIVVLEPRETDAGPEVACVRGIADDDVEPLVKRLRERQDDPDSVSDDWLRFPVRSGRERGVGEVVLFRRAGWGLNFREHAFLDRALGILKLGILRRLAESEIQQLAFFDSLTGLPNRRLLMDRIEVQLANARRHGWFGALVFLDLDHFKTLNDALGHAVGDQMLYQVSRRLQERFRGNDTVARLGGDEFVLLLASGAEAREQAVYNARSIADQVCALLGRPYDLSGQTHHLTASAGIVIFPTDDDGPGDLLRKADAALYSAKAAGRNGAQFFEQRMQLAADARLRLGKELRAAINQSQFVLHYQARVDVEGRVVGAEALIRWQHPQRGLVPPDEFVPAAEETGAIVEIGEWVIRAACEQLADWQRTDMAPFCRQLSINVSPWQFRQRNFVDTVQQQIHRSGIDPGNLVLELTETVLMENLDDGRRKMEALNSLGLSFAIDDFGTGYSSLYYLRSLPVREIKIDRSFVGDIELDHNDAAIVDAIIAMAKRLSLQVVAEGVETATQLDYLRGRGCEYYQGYYFGRPLSAADYASQCREQLQPGSGGSPATS